MCLTLSAIFWILLQTEERTWTRSKTTIIKSLENNKDKDQEKLLCQVRFNCSIGCGHRLVDISYGGYRHSKEHPIMHHLDILDTLGQLEHIRF